ncbi:pupal cuticle protein 36-like [Diprion similis]|uniref:pupal cuticle protein 36-like n=1 Tax=Diprion similis TaxID=362088 RepID=UPI001EF85FD9|nr:pupal cuticle protein 36-like [Diprion similis]
MKIAALLFVFGVASAARLEKTYLPPISAATAGGAGLVQAPGLFTGAYNPQAHVTAAGSYHGQQIAITKYDNQNNADGSYRYNYETANGISAEETGIARGNTEAVSGFYSYTGTDGLKYTVHYTADENGFHPEGAHLPTPPPIPEEIRRGVELSLAAEARGENQGGQYHPGSVQVYNNQHSSAGANAGGYHYFAATALLLTIGVAAAARLDHTYLPPGSAASAGGAGLVQPPGFGGSYNRPASISAPTYKAQSGSYNQAQSGAYQGQTEAYQGQSGAYQGQSGAYQGQKTSYNQGQTGYSGQQYAIKQYNNDNNGDGSYRFNYETENGILAQEVGVLQGDSESVSGSYSYTGPDGVIYTVEYTAGPDGFHPQGAHLPTPPPIPEEIRRGVELSLAAEARGENQDGQYRAEPQQNNYQKTSYQGASVGVNSASHAGYRY